MLKLALHIPICVRLTVTLTVSVMDGHVKAPQGRRPRGSLSRAQVVETALRMADEQGIEGLSMPKLARELECGVMTIYGYVSSKEELITAAAQRGLADLHLPVPLPHSAEDILIVWGRALRGTHQQGAARAETAAIDDRY